MQLIFYVYPSKLKNPFMQLFLKYLSKAEEKYLCCYVGNGGTWSRATSHQMRTNPPYLFPSRIQSGLERIPVGLSTLIYWVMTA
jgi:hypothetical protein